MPLFNETLQNFLASPLIVGDTLLPTHYAHFEGLDDFQVGFRTHGHTGESLVDKAAGEWQPEWYVIALTGLDDPVFIASSHADCGYPVYTAVHGSGRWDAVLIAPDLNTFAQLLTAMAEVPDIAALTHLIDTLVGPGNPFWQAVIDERESAAEEQIPSDSGRYNPADFEEGDLIVSDPGPQKLSVVQLISKRRCLSLKETLALAGAPPLTADSGVRMRLQPFAEQLQALGATVEFRTRR